MSQTAAGTYRTPINSFVSLPAIKCLAIFFCCCFLKGKRRTQGISQQSAKLQFPEIFWNKLLNNQFTRIWMITEWQKSTQKRSVKNRSHHQNNLIFFTARITSLLDKVEAVNMYRSWLRPLTPSGDIFQQKKKKKSWSAVSFLMDSVAESEIWNGVETTSKYTHDLSLHCHGKGRSRAKSTLSSITDTITSSSSQPLNSWRILTLLFLISS